MNKPNIQKELLTIEFRYHDLPKYEHDSGHRRETLTIGVFDTIEEAVKEGNKVLGVLANHFQVRPDDKFNAHGLFGNPDRLVTNCCYPTNGIQYFAQITSLKFFDLSNVIRETFEAYKRYYGNG